MARNAAAVKVNKCDLCAAAGISRTTLDAQLAADPGFPVRRRGTMRGDGWEFDRDAALARLAATGTRRGEPTPSQEFMAIRVVRERRKLAEEAGELFRRSDVVPWLDRLLRVLGKELRAIPTAAGDQLGLTLEQQHALRWLIEDRQRAFVAGARERRSADEV